MRDLARMWSLEMQWFSPEVAQSLVLRLHQSGWLVGEAGMGSSEGGRSSWTEIGWEVSMRERPVGE